MRRYYLFVILLGLVSMLSGQNNNVLWFSADRVINSKNDFSNTKIGQQELVLFNLNLDLLNSQLSKAPKRGSLQKNSGVIISFPNDEGGLEKFQILEASVFDEVLQAKFPNIKSYIGKGLYKSGSRIRFSISPYGLNAIINRPDGKAITIKPYVSAANNIYSVSPLDTEPLQDVDCGLDAINSNLNSFSRTELANFKNATDGILRTFRLAISTTSEYSLDVLTDLGVDVNAEEHIKKTAVLSQINNIVTFLNEVYERDIGITFQLVADNDLIIFFDTTTDGLPHNNKFAVRDANQVVQDNIIGSDNYDIGHVFDFGGNGGVATIATVCVDGEKAKGASEISSLYFRNLTVAHEIGHQFGANHTFNKCSSNMVQSATTVEPGSGTTIMSYAGTGICASYNVDVKGEYFHYINILEMWNNISSGNSTCAIQTSTSNTAPEIIALLNYTLPISTHFALTADAIDANNDELSYTWEQIDPELTMAPPEATSTVGPSFRSFPPTASPTRYFPNLETIHAGGISNTWEVMPSVSRTMNFAVTVRDNNIEVGQTVSATTSLTFDDSSGPFQITYPSTSEIWTIGDSKIITWDVANTDLAPVNCSLVNILFSTDGGLTYNIELASNTPNDGSEIITVPDSSILHGKIKVESVGNIFFDVSPEIEISIDGNPNTTAIPDPNFELALRNLGFDSDGIENGKVITKDIENVSSLNLSNKSINSLIGIEDFISLIDLDCSVNFITSLDLSANLFLEELNCATNSINQLNVTQNINLNSLFCNSNQLTGLDVTNNILLEDLRCYSNPLNALDVTNNLKLATLHCYFNFLTELDITHNVLLKDLRCYSNLITEIDTSENSSLENLWCWSNLITSIDVSQNLLLTSFACHNNQISSLDLSQNYGLVFIYCNSNQLESLKLKNGNNTSIAAFNASNNPNLYCIEVDNASDANAGLGDYNSWVKDAYAKYYENCGTTAIPDPNFEQYLITNGIDEDGVINQKVVTLDIVDEYYVTLPANANITDITGIEDFDNLFGLSISFNSIPEIDVSNNTNLNSIDAQNSGLTSLDISNNILLTTLRISGNLIEELDLTTNQIITFVDVSSNQIKKLDISLNTNVERLFCANNNLEYLNAQNGNNLNFLYFDTLNNPNLYCIKVDDVDYSMANWLDKDEQSSYSTNCNLLISPKIYLQGAAVNPESGEESLMRDDLRSNGLIPTTSPYTDALTCDASVFNAIGQDAIVDWVWIELRDENNNTIVIQVRSALLQRDGDVVDIDGISVLTFYNISANYYLMISHRNHIGILSANTLSLNSTVTVADFRTNSALVTGGTNGIADMGDGSFALFSGDFSGDGQIQNSDKNAVEPLRGLNGYNNADIDMNNQVQNTDLNIALNPNIGRGEQFTKTDLSLFAKRRNKTK